MICLKLKITTCLYLLIYIYIHLHAYEEPGFLTTQALTIRIFGTANGQIDDSLGEVVGAFRTKNNKSGKQLWSNAFHLSHQKIPSWELTYPTLEKRKIIFKSANMYSGYVSFLEGIPPLLVVTKYILPSSVSRASLPWPKTFQKTGWCQLNFFFGIFTPNYLGKMNQPILMSIFQMG